MPARRISPGPRDPVGARPTRSGRTSSIFRTNPRGLHLRALAAHARLRALLQRGARHGHRPLPRDLQGGRAAARPRASPTASASRVTSDRFRTATAAASIGAGRCASRFDGRPYDGRRRATRSPRRCSPTACIWSGGSFKYHRPRGILSRRLGGAERARDRAAAAGASTPNLRATPGRALRRPRRRPARTAGRRSRFDIGAVNDLLSPLFPAGFYYKTFMWPRALLGPRSTSR